MNLLPKSRFHQELEDLINRHSKENDSNTPDFILAEYLVQCLNAYEWAVKKREAFSKNEVVPISNADIAIRREVTA
jgi:hypothetical protein